MIKSKRSSEDFSCVPIYHRTTPVSSTPILNGQGESNLKLSDLLGFQYFKCTATQVIPES